MFPPMIQETVASDGNNHPDFLITLNTATGETSFIGYNPAAVLVEKTYKLEKGWVVRILLRKSS